MAILWVTRAPPGFNASNSRFLPTNLSSANGLRTDATNSRYARDKIRCGLGAGRNLQLQTASKRTSVFHAQGPARTDRVRDFSQYHCAVSASAGRWNASAGLRQRFRFRSARAIPAPRANARSQDFRAELGSSLPQAARPFATC